MSSIEGCDQHLLPHPTMYLRLSLVFNNVTIDLKVLGVHKNLIIMFFLKKRNLIKLLDNSGVINITILLSHSNFEQQFYRTPSLRDQFSKSHVRLRMVILRTCCMRVILNSVRLIWRKLRDITRSRAGVLNTGRSNVNFNRSRRGTHAFGF